MGIRFYCPNGHKLNVKEFQAGRRGICPFCGARIQIPTQSTRPSSKSAGRQGAAQATTQTLEHEDPESAQASDSSPDILPGEPPSLPGDPHSGKMLGPSTPVGVPSASGPVIAPPTVSNAGQEPATAGRSGAAASMSAAPAAPSPPAPLPSSRRAPCTHGRQAGEGNVARSAPAQQPSSAPLPSPAQPAPSPVQPAPVTAVPAPVPPTAAPASPAPTAMPVPTAPAAPATPPAPPQPPAPEPADPIAEAPEMIWYVRPPSGGQFGPASGDLMKTWLSEGRVSADSLVWREGWRDWQEAGTVFPKLRSNQLIDFLETTPVVPVVTPATHVHRPKVRQSPDRNQIVLLVGLSLLVMVLIFVFLWELLK